MAYITLIKKLVSLGCTEFSGSIAWFSNGMRGHLHGSNSCSKLRERDTVTQHFTYKEVFDSGKTVCKECDRSLARTNEAVAAVQSATFLDSVPRTITNLLDKAAVDPFSGYPGLLALRFNASFKNLQQNVKLKGAVHGLERWQNECLALIENSLLPESPHTLQSESLRYAALSCLDTELRERDNLSTGNLWGGQEALNVCGALDGYGASRNNPLYSLSTAWVAANNNSISTSQEVLDVLFAETSIAAIIGKPESLERLGFVSPAQLGNGETIVAFASRAWSDKVTSILRDVSTHWAQKYHAYFNEDELVAFGVIGSEKIEYCEEYGSTLPNPVIHAQTTVSPQTAHGHSGTTVVVCPRIVAKYIANVVKNRHRHEVTPMLRGIGDKHLEHAEIAATLWSPKDKSSVYANFEIAYKAAMKI